MKKITSGLMVIVLALTITVGAFAGDCCNGSGCCKGKACCAKNKRR